MSYPLQKSYNQEGYIQEIRNYSSGGALGTPKENVYYYDSAGRMIYERMDYSSPQPLYQVTSLVTVNNQYGHIQLKQNSKQTEFNANNYNRWKNVYSVGYFYI